MENLVMEQMVMEQMVMDNLVMVQDANENIRPAKDKATDRIDGFVALIMAWKLTIQNEQTYFYMDRDLRTL